MRQAGALTKYAGRFRHPGAPYEPALNAGRAAFGLAREVLAAMGDRLPPGVRTGRIRFLNPY
jgi:hypothetical protein